MKLALRFTVSVIVLAALFLTWRSYQEAVYAASFESNVCYQDILRDIRNKIKTANDKGSLEMYQELEEYMEVLLVSKDVPCQVVHSRMEAYNKSGLRTR